MTVDADRLRDTFLELVRIPSPSRDERAAVDHVAERLRGLGLEPEEDGAADAVGGTAGNLLARIPASADGPALLLAAHLDTVETGETPITPVVHGDLVTSDGTSILGADDKAGAAVLLELAATLAEDPVPHGEIRLLFSVAEECEILGAKALPDAWLADLGAALILDHSNPAEIVVGAPAKLALRITVHGVEGHAAMPERRVNAAHALATALARLPSGRLDPFSTANLGIMQSGTRINIIPGLATAEYEIRSHRNDLLEYHLEAALAVIEAAVREARVHLLGDDLPEGEDPVRRATVEVEVDRCYEAYRVRETALPVRILKEAIRAEGGEPALRVAAGGSDANALNARGCDAVVYGCGMHGAHSVRESADLREMTRAVRTLRRAVRSA